MRTLLFTLLLMASPCYADSLWGDYGDIGPRGGGYADDYIGDPRIYGSVSQQLNNIDVDLQMQRLQERRYQREVVEEMRRANEIAEDEARERQYERSRRSTNDFLKSFGR